MAATGLFPYISPYFPIYPHNLLYSPYISHIFSIYSPYIPIHSHIFPIFPQYFPSLAIDVEERRRILAIEVEDFSASGRNREGETTRDCAFLHVYVCARTCTKERAIDGAKEASERRRESWTRGVAAGVPVIRAGRTLSDRNGAIIRGPRDVKRSALCAHRPYEAEVAAVPRVRFCGRRPKYRAPYNLTSNYSSLMPRECLYRAHVRSLARTLGSSPRRDNFIARNWPPSAESRGAERHRPRRELGESGPAFEKPKSPVSRR